MTAVYSVFIARQPNPQNFIVPRMKVGTEKQNNYTNPTMNDRESEPLLQIGLIYIVCERSLQFLLQVSPLNLKLALKCVAYFAVDRD